MEYKGYELCEYLSDEGNITLFHESGARLSLPNNYNRGVFEYYIVYDRDKMTMLGCSLKNKIEISLGGHGWKVMFYDLATSFDCYGIKIIGSEIEIYRIHETTFVFVVS